MNKVIIIGNLGADPELRYTQGGQAVANFRVATTDKWTDKDGKSQERTEWHRIVVWGRQAENCEKYLRKGSKVAIEARIQTREWEDKDGAKRYTTELVAQSVQFLSTSSGGGGGGDRRDSPPPDDSSFGDTHFNDDDIPF